MTELEVKFALSFARLDDLLKVENEIGISKIMGEMLLRDSEVKLLIKHRREELGKAARINRENVLADWYDIKTADVEKAVKIERVNCRYCNGAGHNYQWSQSEFNKACEYSMLNKKPMPDMSGGLGFNPWGKPNVNCVECGGVGIEKVFLESFDNLPNNVKKSIASVKAKADGSVELVFRDKDKANDSIARYLGMFIERKEITGSLGIKRSVEDLTDEELMVVINGEQA